MAGGYNNQFSQYQALPTNLQHYTGGTGSPALMHQNQQQGPQGQPGGFGRPMFGGFGHFGGFPLMMSPFMRSPYGFMGSMGQNWGMPTNYNQMAQSMTGIPTGGHQPAPAPVAPPTAPVRQAPVRQPPNLYGLFDPNARGGGRGGD